MKIMLFGMLHWCTLDLSSNPGLLVGMPDLRRLPKKVIELLNLMADIQSVCTPVGV